MESFSHETSAFVTLTYNDAHLPFQNEKTGELLNIPTLRYEHAQKFLKKIRKAVGSKLRYFIAGEYGSDYRPHYHLALFGYEPCRRGKTNSHNHRKGRSCCPPCDLLYEKWKDNKLDEHYGTIDNGDIQKASAGYIAGYVTKKMFKADDDLNPAELEHRRLKHGLLSGRIPEFQRQSLQPGLGALDVQLIADALHSEYGANMLNEFGDVPQYLHFKGKELFLDRYIRTQIRKHAELPEIYDIYTGEIYGEGQYEQKKAYQEKMHSMHENYLSASKDKPQTFKEFLFAKDKMKIQKIEKLHDLKGKRK